MLTHTHHLFDFPSQVVATADAAAQALSTHPNHFTVPSSPVKKKGLYNNKLTRFLRIYQTQLFFLLFIVFTLQQRKTI